MGGIKMYEKPIDPRLMEDEFYEFFLKEEEKFPLPTFFVMDGESPMDRRMRNKRYIDKLYARYLEEKK